VRETTCRALRRGHPILSRSASPPSGETSNGVEEIVVIGPMTRLARGADYALEAATSIGSLATAEHADLLIELLADPLPGIRGTALRALARVDPDVFIATLAGLDERGCGRGDRLCA